MIRSFKRGDPVAIAGIFTRAIHEIACSAKKLQRVYVDASICAKSMFEQLGFTVIEENLISMGDVPLINYRMEYIIPNAEQGDSGND